MHEWRQLNLQCWRLVERLDEALVSYKSKVVNKRVKFFDNCKNLKVSTNWELIAGCQQRCFLMCHLLFIIKAKKVDCQTKTNNENGNFKSNMKQHHAEMCVSDLEISSEKLSLYQFIITNQLYQVFRVEP